IPCLISLANGASECIEQVLSIVGIRHDHATENLAMPEDTEEWRLTVRIKLRLLQDLAERTRATQG
ncbi:hypothetical protein L9G15_25055, partial [Shewanella sp. A3A]|nr:hypothetical protein [Shewanella ferrihydritica]